MAAKKKVRASRNAEPIDEDSIFWTPGLLNRVIPRRGGNAGVGPRKGALAEIQAAMDAELRARETHARAVFEARSPGHDVLQRVVASALLGTCSEDRDDAAVLHAWIASEYNSDTGGGVRTSVEWLCTVGGLAHAVAAVVLAVELDWVEPPYALRRALPELHGQLALARHSASDPSPNLGERGDLRGLDCLRYLLATASDEDHRAALDVARSLRTVATRNQEIALSYLFPDEREWARSDAKWLTSEPGFIWLLASVNEAASLPAQPLGLAKLFTVWMRRDMPGDLPATLLANLGLDAAPTLAAAGQQPVSLDAVHRKRWFDTLAAVGADITMDVLLLHHADKSAQGALTRAASVQPRRVLRRAAAAIERGGKGTAPLREQLRLLVKSNPATAAEVAPTLGDVGRRIVEDALSDHLAPVEEAAPGDMPAFLLHPPWRTVNRAPVVVREDLVIDHVAPTLALDPGELTRWRAASFGGDSSPAYGLSHADWVELASPTSEATVTVDMMAACPPEHLSALMLRCTTKLFTDVHYYEPVVAAHGLAALPFYALRASLDLVNIWSSLAPIGASVLAPMIARAMATRRALVPTAGAWLVRFPEHATAGLLQAALGKPGRERDYAEAAIRHIALHGDREMVLRVAERAEALPEIRTLLALDPLHAVPAQRPRPPGYLDPALLHRPSLRSGGGVLTHEATLAALEMLAFCPLESDYVGLRMLADACESQSLHDFSLSILTTWISNGGPSKDRWCLTQLALIGGDSAARALGAMIPTWTRPGHKTWALAGIDVLTVMGSDVALMQLHSVVNKVRQVGVKAKAEAALDAVALHRGLTRADLEDRLVPDLGLDDRGTRLFDFGGRTFTVGFDEALSPVVSDSAGVRLPDLPKPRKQDDAHKAKLAVREWVAIKRDARKAISLRLTSLEHALRSGRRMDAATFDVAFVRHPLSTHVARRLVWGTYERNTLLTTFRVAEDQSLADEDDLQVTVAPGSRIGLVHPVELGALRCSKWAALFDDYEIVQPFLQLTRPVYTFEEGGFEMDSGRLTKGLNIGGGAIFALESKGWRMSEPGSGGFVQDVQRVLPHGYYANVPVSPGYASWDRRDVGLQTLGPVTLHRAGHSMHVESPSFAVLDPIAYSELVCDLKALAR